VVHRKIISSLAKGMTNHPRKGRVLAHVTNFCTCNGGLRTRDFATAEGPRDALASRNSATTKHPI